MKHFRSIEDVPSLPSLLMRAKEIVPSPSIRQKGNGKVLGLIFFNPSLRTRLSSQRAAVDLGLSVIVMNINQDSWKLEFEDGTVMDGGKAEHVKDAVAVMGQYCDIIGVRSFANLENREEDYEEKVLDAFVKYSGVPIISLESATRHPLQSLADMLTIERFTTYHRPKVVLTWAPHPRALPQAVANSFCEWIQHMEVDCVVTHPKGYELAPEFMGALPVEYDQAKAFEGADFVYAKNWSSYSDYGQVLSKDPAWTVSVEKMALTNEAKFMHCLPVRRNVVVEDAVIDSPNSVVQVQASNRVVSAKVVLSEMLDQL